MRQSRGARRVVVAILTGLALSLSGALLAPGANASAGTRASTGAAVPPTAVASFICGKSWKTKTMDAKKVRKFVKIFKRTVKSGKDIATAFGIASSTTGIGTLPGVAIAVVAKFGGDFIVNFVLNKLTKSLKTYERVGIRVGVKCKWGAVPYPVIGFHGPKR